MFRPGKSVSTTGPVLTRLAVARPRRFIGWVMMLAIFHSTASFSKLPSAPASGNASVWVASPIPMAGYGEFTPRDCPPISDHAIITAKIATADSGAPATQHPGLDLWVRDGTLVYIIRVHFGNRGDGTNACLSFNECKDTKELPYCYPVKTSLVKNLFADLRRRGYCVGKFVSWGVPIFPWHAQGSNCGDALVVVLKRLEIAPEALPDMRQWIRQNGKGKWAFDRGRRRPTDGFFTDTPANDPR